ncbi:MULTISPECIES: hypothetical protein [unclassified Sphingomonas]|uniref:hypothetical protein n=1 Tax=unclassified Sphingomonas TaxID=196159 RepID=UPI000700029E|nr:MULTISPECIES: hypothetical protein [unclassified Sphingomonas]KQX19349.1 hypothetical protein ASD17_12465 [Sphingomonas sp. Root1294]KQY65552.1 hypothetical protein ASD39_15665 [Sphingomonas sp. Root50]KRB95148.1 hypothetical protein ASE22_04395 [Sphingomonas sp. Root720]
MGIADIKPQDAPDLRPSNDGPEDREPDRPLLPAGCPVTPLGRLGTASYFLDEARQMVKMSTKDWNDVCIMTLYGRQYNFLEQNWPRYGKPVKDPATGKEYYPIVGFVYADVKKAMVQAASFAGIFDPEGKVRERGAHRGSDGELILHCGDRVLIGGLKRVNGESRPTRWADPGLVDGYVYPTKPGIPKPAPESPDTAPAAKTYAMLKTWNWVRPSTDPWLLLGLLGAMAVAGALPWRPHGWITGSRGTGKTTLNGEHGLIAIMFGDGVIRTADATEAGIRQLTKLQTLPIMFDEREPSEQGTASDPVIKLARLASSGSKIHRGSQDHTAQEFAAQTCFLFSSILVPPMLAQDRSRLTFFELKKLEDGSGIRLDPVEWRQNGAQLRRRMVDQWPRFQETLEAYQLGLMRVGFDQRGQDQYGTLLACVDLLMFDSAAGLLEEKYDPIAEDVMPSRVAEWAERLRFIMTSEQQDDRADEADAATHLASSYLHTKGGEDLEPISRVLRKGMMMTNDQVLNRARSRLSAVGLRLVNKVDKIDKNGQPVVGIKPAVLGERVYVAIGGKRLLGLAKLFEKTVWAGGVWGQSFGRLPDAIKGVDVKFDGIKDRATLVPLEHICSLEIDDEDRPLLPEQGAL